MQDEFLRRFLKEAKTIAVFGFSSRPSRPGFYVARYLQEQGYRVIPINPAMHEQASGLPDEMCYRDLPSAVRATGAVIDIVDVFRKSEDTPAALQQAIEIQARMIWLQQGIFNDSVKEQGERMNMHVIMDRCLKTEHQRLILNLSH